jgi:predicted permease
VGLILAAVLQLDGVARGVLVLQCAMPAAVFNYLFAQRYARAPEEVASIVVVSTLLAFAGLPVLLGFLL